MRSDLILALHTYLPEQTVTLANYYRNLINMVKGIITKSCMCNEVENKLLTRQDIDSKKHAKCQLLQQNNIKRTIYSVLY